MADPLKRGVLYRSANHTYATEADLERMRALGVAAIIDLRRPDERTREPSRRWADFQAQVVENDIHSEHPDWAETMKGATLSPQWFLDDGVAYYRRAPFEPRHLDLWSRYFRTLAEAPGAIVVHCAAGKDRTGMICALTHHIAGVHPDDIMADFLETNNEERMARKMAFLGPWLRRPWARPSRTTRCGSPWACTPTTFTRPSARSRRATDRSTATWPRCWRSTSPCARGCTSACSADPTRVI